MASRKIPVKALKYPKYAYVLDQWRDGDYGHVRGRVYSCRGYDWQCMCSFQWQYSAFQGQRALSSYGCQLSLDVSFGPRAEEVLPLVKRIVGASHYGGFGLRYFLQRMRALSIPRWTFVRVENGQFTALNEPVPRPYRSRAAEYLQARALVAC